MASNVRSQRRVCACQARGCQQSRPWRRLSSPAAGRAARARPSSGGRQRAGGPVRGPQACFSLCSSFVLFAACCSGRPVGLWSSWACCDCFLGPSASRRQDCRWCCWNGGSPSRGAAGTSARCSPAASSTLRATCASAKVCISCRPAATSERSPDGAYAADRMRRWGSAVAAWMRHDPTPT